MTMLFPIAIFALIALISIKVFGPDNAVEEVMEEAIETDIEKDLHLPDGTLDIDFTPHSDNP